MTIFFTEHSDLGGIEFTVIDHQEYISPTLEDAGQEEVFSFDCVTEFLETILVDQNTGDFEFTDQYGDKVVIRGLYDQLVSEAKEQAALFGGE